MSNWQDYVNNKYKKKDEKQSYAEHVQEKYGNAGNTKEEAVKKAVPSAPKYVGWGSKAQPNSIKRTEAKQPSEFERRQTIRAAEDQYHSEAIRRLQQGMGEFQQEDRQTVGPMLKNAPQTYGGIPKNTMERALETLNPIPGLNADWRTRALDMADEAVRNRRSFFEDFSRPEEYAEYLKDKDAQAAEDALAAIRENRTVEVNGEQIPAEELRKKTEDMKASSMVFRTPEEEKAYNVRIWENERALEVDDRWAEREEKEQDKKNKAARQQAMLDVAKEVPYFADFDFERYQMAQPPANGDFVLRRMTDEERAVYRYFAINQGEEAANEYYEAMKPVVEQRELGKAAEELKTVGNEHPVLGSALSAMMNVSQGIQGAGKAAYDVYKNVTDPEYEIDPYDQAYHAGYMRDALREGAAQDMSPVGRFLYQTGMSVMDSTLGATLLGGTGGAALLASSAMTDTAKDAKLNGATDGQAIGLGVAAGLAELVTEKMGFDRLSDMIGGNRGNVFRAILGHMASEFGEESATEIANILTDALIMTDKSEWMALAAEKGEKQALMEILGRVGLAGLGGALSGAAMGGGASAIGAIDQAVQRRGEQKAMDLLGATDILSNGARGDQTVYSTTQELARLAQEAADAEIAEEQALAVKPAQAGAQETTEAAQPAPVQTPARRETAAQPAQERRADIREAAQRIQDEAQKRQFVQTAEKYGEAALVFAGNYEGGDIAAYDRGFNTVYTAGRTGIPLEKMRESADALTAGMSEMQKRAIWQAGRNEDVNTVAPGVKQLTTVKTTDAQKRQYKMLDVIGKRYGYQFDVVDSINAGMANGAYSGGRRIVVAADAADGAVVQTGVHELVHALKKNDADGFEVLKNVVVKHLEGSENWLDMDYAVNERMEQYRAAGQNLTEADALEEIICEAVPTFLTDEKAVRAFVNQNRTLAMKIRDFFVNFAKEIREIAERYMFNQGRGEIANLLGRSDALTEIALTFDRALEAAGEKEAAPGGETVFAGRKKEINGADDVPVSKEESGRVAADLPVSGETESKWSLARNSEFMDNARAANEKTGKVDSETLDEAERMRAAVKAYMEEHSEVMRLPADIEGDTFFADGAYGGSEENTSVCVRSMAVQELMDIIAKDLGRPLTVEDTLLISQEVAGYTDKPECYYCYVAQDRRAIREFLGGYIDQREEVLKRIRAGEDKESVRQSWLNGRKNTPNMKARFDFWTSADSKGIELIKASDLAHMENLNAEITNLQTRIADAIGGKVTFVGIGYKQDGGRARSFDGVLKTADDALRAGINRYIQLADALSYAKSASWAKKQTGYAAYNGHILKWKDEKIAGLNSHYGLRMYSFSDFSPAFILENMQMLTDAAVRGLKVLAYTKEMDFARIFAPTGANINISTFAQEINGQITADGMMGADWAEAIRLREKYPNVGITFVATSDRLAEWAEQQDWIDTVIPYHLVRTGTKVAQYFGYKNYTAESSDRKKAGVKFKKGDVTSIPPEMHDNDIVKYVEALEKHNLTPRFENRLKGYREFIDGTISESEFRAMNPYYMKYVNETRRSASQTPSVQPVFELDDAIESMKNMIKEGGYGAPIGQSYEVMQEIGEEIADKIRGQENQVRFSLNNTAPIESVMADDQNLMLPADVDVREESIKGVAASALSRGINERMNQQITGIANKILKETGSTYAKADIIANMKSLIDEYAENGATEDALRAVAEMAKKIIESSRHADNTLREQYADLRKKLRETGISLTDTQKQEAANEAGSYNAYRQSLMGTVKLTNDGISLDAIWGKISSQNPEIFPPDTGEAEMVGRLTDFMMLMKPKYENPYGMDMDGAALEMAMRIQGDLMGILGARDAAKAMYGTAEKFRKQYEAEFKVRLAEQKKERVEKFQKIAADLKAAKAAGNAKEQAAVMNRYRAAMKATALDEAYAEVRATYKAREEQKAENRKANELRGRVAKRAGELMKMFARPEKGKRIPTGLQGLVLDALGMLDINGEHAAAAGKETKKAAEFRDKLGGIRSFYEQVINSQSKGEAPEGMDGLMMAFTERNMAAMNEALDILGGGDKFRLRDMNSEQLKMLDELLKNIKHTVESVGKLWKIHRYQSVVELGNASIAEMDERGQQKIDADSAAGKGRDFFALDMLEPVSYGERLGEGGGEIIQGLLDGEKEKFSKIREAAEATKQMMKDAGITGYDIGKWRKNVHAITLGSGRVIRMSDVNIMELYLTANRPQGLQHLLANGMKIQSKESGQQPRHILITQADITNISGMLDAKQKKIADLMQKYLSGDVAKWGNDVTQRLYLYDAFGEQTYWPISSDPNSLKTQEPEADRAFTAITNAGFTKPLNAKATNPIIIGDAFDTFDRHIGEMASYAGYAEVMTDTLAWINYRQKSDDGLMAGSVKESIETLLGKGGIKYLTKLVQDINGARRGGDGMQIANALLRNYKANAVAGKIRVAIQQPMSIVRAAAEINPAYLLTGLKAGKDAIAEMQKHSALAWWKGNGNYDIGIGKSTDEIFWGDTKRSDTVMEKISTSGGLIDPGKMDDWAWARMWSAVKREISRTRPELKQGSDEYFKAVAERFEYIMDRTQVVDTVMHRSDMMRSKDGLTQMLTSFKAEPTKSYNMLMRAIMEVGRNPKSKAAKLKLARTTGAFAASAAATAAATALFDAFKNRDDEDDLWTYLTEGGFWTDWTKAFLNGFAGNINIAGSIPLVGEALEALQGEDVTLMQFESLTNSLNAVTTFWDHLFGENKKKTTVWGAVKPILTAASQATGLPVSGLIANSEMLARIYDPKLMQAKSNMAATEQAFEKLYDAVLSGDRSKELEIRTELAKGMYGKAPKSVKEIDAGISDQLAISDERILKAWQMKNTGKDTKGLVALYKEIQKDGFTDDMIKRAVNNAQNKYQAEYDALIDDEKPNEAQALLEKCAKYGMNLEKEKEPKDLEAELKATTYTDKELFRIIRNGDLTDIAAAAEIKIAESEAKKPEETVRSAVSGEFREEYVELVKSGNDREADKLAEKLAIFDLDEEDLLEWVKDDYRSNLKKAIEKGDMKESERLIETMRDEYGLDDESIASTVRSRFKQDYIDLVMAGNDREADKLAEKLMNLGLKYSDGNNRFKQANLNKWVLDWEKAQEDSE